MYTSVFEKKYLNLGEICLKYTSEFEHKYMNLESQIQVPFWVSK